MALYIDGISQKAYISDLRYFSSQTFTGTHYANSGTAQPTFIFQAPAVCYVKGCYFITSSSDPTDASNYWSFNIHNETQDNNLLASAVHNGSSGTAIVAWTPYALTPDQNNTMAANDVIQLVSTSSNDSATRLDNMRFCLIYSFDIVDVT